jgi:hypothetical protein
LILQTTILAGFARNRVVDPVFIDGTITGSRYREVLVDRFFPMLQEAGFNLDTLWWQQDSAPAHIAGETIQLLRDFFGQRVITRSPHFDEDAQWPARSCDLSMCDVWLWNYVKVKVRQRNPLTMLQLENVIEHVFQFEISQEMCNRVFECFVSRLEKCVATGGEHIEKNDVLR